MKKPKQTVLSTLKEISDSLKQLVELQKPVIIGTLHKDEPITKTLPKVDYYTPVSLGDQRKLIRNLFGINMPFSDILTMYDDLPQNAEHWFVIPHWKKLGATYNEALQKVLDAIKQTRPFYNWREGQLGSDRLRPLDREVPEIIACQFGAFHKGKSVNEVRKNQTKNEILLGAYEIGIMLLTHPDRLKSYDDLWIDCPGDEYGSLVSDGRFDSAPYWVFFDDEVRFGTEWVSLAHDCYGSASGFLSQ